MSKSNQSRKKKGGEYSGNCDTQFVFYESNYKFFIYTMLELSSSIEH